MIWRKIPLQCVAILFAGFLWLSMVATPEARAQNVSQWSGTYRCIPSARHCIGGWDGEIRIAGGNVMGNLTLFWEGAAYKGAVTGRIDPRGDFLGTAFVMHGADDKKIEVDITGPLWEASASLITRSFMRGAKRRDMGRLRFIEPARFAEIEKANAAPAGRTASAARSVPSSPQTMVSAEPMREVGCDTFVGTFTVRAATSDSSERLRSGGGCLDQPGFTVLRDAVEDWVEVRLDDGRVGFVEVTNPSLRAYVGAALAVAPTLALPPTRLAAQEPLTVPATVAQAPRAPESRNPTPRTGPCIFGPDDYVVRVLPDPSARPLISGRGCLDDLELDVVAETSRAGWFLVRLPSGRSGFVDARANAAMTALVAALGTAVANSPPVAGAPRSEPAIAAPDLEPIDRRFVAIGNANVREGPDVRAQRVATVAQGTVVVALGRVRGADWFFIARDGAPLGYVFAPLIAEEGSPEALAALAPLTPQRSADVPENRHAVAVIIGNRRYGGDIPDVTYAHNDADAVRRHVIDVLGYRDGNVIDLRDATLADFNRVFGTERSRRAQLANWIRDGRSDVTVFYSGHGVPGLEDRRGYLLPVDGDPNLAELTGYSLDTLHHNLSRLPARSVQIFLDACFSGNSAGGSLLRATSGIGLSPALPEGSQAGVVMVTAASGDQVASWDEDAGHGLFTRHLLMALQGLADTKTWGDGNGQVTLGEVKTYLDDEMTFQARKRFNREQTATIAGGRATVVSRME